MGGKYTFIAFYFWKVRVLFAGFTAVCRIYGVARRTGKSAGTSAVEGAGCHTHARTHVHLQEHRLEGPQHTMAIASDNFPDAAHQFGGNSGGGGGGGVGFGSFIFGFPTPRSPCHIHSLSVRVCVCGARPPSSLSPPWTVSSTHATLELLAEWRVPLKDAYGVRCGRRFSQEHLRFSLRFPSALDRTEHSDNCFAILALLVGQLTIRAIRIKCFMRIKNKKETATGL